MPPENEVATFTEVSIRTLEHTQVLLVRFVSVTCPWIELPAAVAAPLNKNPLEDAAFAENVKALDE